MSTKTKSKTKTKSAKGLIPSPSDSAMQIKNMYKTNFAGQKPEDFTKNILQLIQTINIHDLRLHCFYGCLYKYPEKVIEIINLCPETNKSTLFQMVSKTHRK